MRPLERSAQAGLISSYSLSLGLAPDGEQTAVPFWRGGRPFLSVRALYLRRRESLRFKHLAHFADPYLVRGSESPWAPVVCSSHTRQGSQDPPLAPWHRAAPARARAASTRTSTAPPPHNRKAMEVLEPSPRDLPPSSALRAHVRHLEHPSRCQS